MYPGWGWSPDTYPCYEWTLVDTTPTLQHHWRLCSAGHPGMPKPVASRVERAVPNSGTGAQRRASTERPDHRRRLPGARRERDPMQARDVHARVEALLGEPVRWSSVKATLAGNVTGPAPDSCAWPADATAPPPGRQRARPARRRARPALRRESRRERYTGRDACNSSAAIVSRQAVRTLAWLRESGRSRLPGYLAVEPDASTTTVRL